MSGNFRWNNETFWERWNALPNRRQFTLNNHHFSIHSGNTELEISHLKCKRSFMISVEKFFLWPKCICCYPKLRNLSVGELKVMNYLESKKYVYEMQKTFKTCKRINKLRFDFYLPVYKLLIEVQGAHHFAPVSYGVNDTQAEKEKRFLEVKERDAIKRQWVKDNKYKFLTLTYQEIENIEEILSDFVD